jgi:hypothetical protein
VQGDLLARSDHELDRAGLEGLLDKLDAGLQSGLGVLEQLLADDDPGFRVEAVDDESARSVHFAGVHAQFEQLSAKFLAGQRVELRTGLRAHGHGGLLSLLGGGKRGKDDGIGEDVLDHAVDAGMDETEIEGALGRVLGDDLPAPDDLLLLDHGLVLLLNGDPDRNGCGDVLETALDFNRGVQA